MINKEAGIPIKAYGRYFLDLDLEPLEPEDPDGPVEVDVDNDLLEEAGVDLEINLVDLRIDDL